MGGGIIGLSCARHALRRFPGARVLVLEKEDAPARHQTGRNSGVIHSGIYYKPGSFKARFARAGAESMARFCRKHGIAHEICGKLIVATRTQELPLLENLFQRAQQNGVPAEKLSREQAREFEPHVACLAALRVRTTGITSYREVCLELLRQIKEAGGDVAFHEEVRSIKPASNHQVIVRTRDHEVETNFIVNCAGLQSDRVARLAGAEPGVTIVPFRGEYFELRRERRHLVRGLIYPVPNPDFPFLGVHFTRMIDGSVHAGPNAVLALAREGYRKRDVRLRDCAETVRCRGFRTLARQNMKEGLKEMWRSLSKNAFTRSLQRLVPEIQAEDLSPCASGIRAQAVADDGTFLDDFSLVRDRYALHVCNAPSPGATAALEIGRTIVEQLPAPAAHLALAV